MPRSVSSSRPVGEIIAAQISHTTPPKGTLYLDGSVLTKSVYAALYAALAGQVVETSTTFTLPDLRGRFIRSLDTTAATVDPDKAARTGGDANKLGSIQPDAYASHIHGMTVRDGGTSFGSYAATTTGSGGIPTINTAASGGSENRPKNFATNYFIRY